MRGANTFRTEVRGMDRAARAASVGVAAIGTAAASAFTLVQDRAGKFDAP